MLLSTRLGINLSQVLYEDDHLIALNKPPGVLTAPKHRYVVSYVLQKYALLLSGSTRHVSS